MWRSTPSRCADAAIALLLVLAGCSSAATPWWETLESDNPCFRVRLEDGVDESSTAELHELFACLNRSGGLEALAPLDTVLDDGTVGADVAGVVNGMTAQQADPLFIITTLLELADVDADGATAWLQLWGELAWGPAFSTLDEAQLASGFDDGALSALWTAAVPLSRHVEAQDPRVFELLADGVAGLGPVVHIVADTPSLVPFFGNVLQALETPANDRWPGSTGNGLRDLVIRLDERGALDELAPVLDTLAATPRAWEGALEIEEPAAVGEGLTALVDLDRQGAPIGWGDTSALRGFTRLIARGDQPLTCTLDFGLAQPELALGNLSENALSALGEQDPSSLYNLEDLMSGVLGLPVDEAMLQGIVDSGACDLLDQAMLDDLRAVDVLFAQPEAFVLVHGIVAAARDHGQIPALVDAIRIIEQAGAVGAIEELIRDVGPLVGDMPSVDATGAVTALLELESGQRDRLVDILVVLARQPATWEAIERLGGLASQPGSAVHRASELASAWRTADPDLAMLRIGRPLLTSERVRSPLFRLLRSGALRDAVSRPASPETTTPAGFVGGRIQDGTVFELIELVRRVRAELNQSNM